MCPLKILTFIRFANRIDSDEMDDKSIPQREATFAPSNRNLTASNPLQNSLFTTEEDVQTNQLFSCQASHAHPFLQSSDEETRESRQTAEAIRRSFSVDLFAHIKLPEAMDTSGSSTGAILGVRTEEPFVAASSALGAPLGFGNIPELTPSAATASTGSLGEFDNIPQSMAEIYKLSTKNKKRKKKKDAKEDSLGKAPQSPFYLNDGYVICHHID